MGPSPKCCLWLASRVQMVKIVRFNPSHSSLMTTYGWD